MVNPVWNLLSRARESQLSSLGTTGLAVSIAGCLWLIRVVAKLSGEVRKTGWKTTAKDWKSHIKEGLIGAGLTALVWCCLFAWNVYKVLNADYQRLSFLEADYPKQKEQADRVKGLEKQIQDLQSKPAPDNRPKIIYRTK